MTQQEEADRRLEEALAARGAHDPRELCRERLRELKGRNIAAYEQAVSYYRSTLVAAVADGSAEPLAAWAEYGRRLAELTAPGRTVGIDPTGRAGPWDSARTGEDLVLHLPDARGARALLVALPARPTLAQRATCELLVAGRQKLPEEPAG